MNQAKNFPLDHSFFCNSVSFVRMVKYLLLSMRRTCSNEALLSSLFCFVMWKQFSVNRRYLPEGTRQNVSISYAQSSKFSLSRNQLTGKRAQLKRTTSFVFARFSLRSTKYGKKLDYQGFNSIHKSLSCSNRFRPNWLVYCSISIVSSFYTDLISVLQFSFDETLLQSAYYTRQ